MISSPFVRVRCYGKINLTLDVLGRRGDGYHELRSIFQTVDWYDTLEFYHETGAHDTLSCDRPELVTHTNLVARAVTMMRHYSGGDWPPTHFALYKQLPIGGGMGGGSSDAASTLRMLNGARHLAISQEDIHAMAARLGSDIPYFLYGGTALVGARGEYVQVLCDLPELAVLLVTPRLTVSTEHVFSALQPAHYTDGAATAALAAHLEGTGASNVATWPPLHNSLQSTTCALYPEVAEVLAALRSTHAQQVAMSGSGPTCFALYLTLGQRDAAASALADTNWIIQPTTFVGRAITQRI